MQHRKTWLILHRSPSFINTWVNESIAAHLKSSSAVGKAYKKFQEGCRTKDIQYVRHNQGYQNFSLYFLLFLFFFFSFNLWKYTWSQLNKDGELNHIHFLIIVFYFLSQPCALRIQLDDRGKAKHYFNKYIPYNLYTRAHAEGWGPFFLVHVIDHQITLKSIGWQVRSTLTDTF